MINYRQLKETCTNSSENYPIDGTIEQTNTILRYNDEDKDEMLKIMQNDDDK